MLTGSLAGLLQDIVAKQDIAPFALRLSFLRQAGIALGTGVAGWSVEHWSAEVTAHSLAALGFAASGFLIFIPHKRVARAPTKNSSGFFAANVETLRYLTTNRSCLCAVVASSLSFAIIQLTNTLLPGFVTTRLKGGSGLFGTLEMTAALAGAAAALLCSMQIFAEALRPRLLLLLAAAGLSLVAFASAEQIWSATLLYAMSGVLWGLARGLAGANLLIVVDNDKIGRVQGITSLLISAVGGLIYSLPTLVPNEGETAIYYASGMAIAGAACLLSAIDRRDGIK
jgi:Na+/melibiose symporter-like transporter